MKINEEMIKAINDFKKNNDVLLEDDTEMSVDKFFDGSFEIYLGYDKGTNCLFESLKEIDDWWDEDWTIFTRKYFSDDAFEQLDIKRELFDKFEVHEIVSADNFKLQSFSISMESTDSEMHSLEWAVSTYKKDDTIFCGMTCNGQLDYSLLFVISEDEHENIIYENNNFPEIFDYFYELLETKLIK